MPLVIRIYRRVILDDKLLLRDGLPDVFRQVHRVEVRIAVVVAKLAGYPSGDHLVNRGGSQGARVGLLGGQREAPRQPE